MKMSDCPVSVSRVSKNQYHKHQPKGDDGYITKIKIFKSEREHNLTVQKKMRQIWHIPRVYTGMNT